MPIWFGTQWYFPISVVDARRQVVHLKYERAKGIPFLQVLRSCKRYVHIVIMYVYAGLRLHWSELRHHTRKP